MRKFQFCSGNHRASSSKSDARVMTKASKLLFVMGLTVAIAVTPQPAEAFWWLAGKVVKKVLTSESKPSIRKGRKDRWDNDRDDYNPYHNHPDGLPPKEYPPVYNENPYKRW